MDTKVCEQPLLGEDEMRLGCEEVDMFGCGIGIDEDHKVLGTRDTLCADFAAKVDVDIFPWVCRPILNCGGRRSGMPSKLCCDANGACQGCQTSFLARFGNAFYVEFTLMPLRYVPKTLVIVEALFLSESLRSLRWSGVIKHRIHLVMLWRIELEEPESGLRALCKGNEIIRVAKDFDARLGAEDDGVACLLGLANAKQSAL